jgi:ketosteroid isomerase-like protein
MNSENEQDQIRNVLEAWNSATKQSRKDDVLVNHLPDALIYDVLAPMKYEGTAAYRKSWDDWQPETNGEGKFDFEDLAISAGTDAGFATGFIRCAGQTPDGRSFEDLVRATFCFKKINGQWKIAHQHISKPIQLSRN